MTKSTSPSGATGQKAVPDLIGSKTRLWTETAKLKDRDVLRLSILRDLVMGLHSEKSRQLATHNRTGAEKITLWEQRLESLMLVQALEGDLGDLIQNVQITAPIAQDVPSVLLSTFPKEKILREDRKWEAALVNKAHQRGWHFWNLDTWVEIPKIEEWTHRLTQGLWPNAFILFVESVPRSGASQTPPTDRLWHGRWWIATRAETDLTQLLKTDLNLWPGSPQNAPDQPVFKLNFPKSKA